MHYLMPNELLQHGWSLYWARTKKFWETANINEPLLQTAYKKYMKLLQEYKNNIEHCNNIDIDTFNVRKEEKITSLDDWFFGD